MSIAASRRWMVSQRSASTQECGRWSRVGAAAALILTQCGIPAYADTGEDIFRDALTYTVQIRTSIAKPFGEDTKGTQSGAGFLVDRQRGWILTNAHVVARSPSRVEVAFRGREMVPARKVYVDPFLDMAVVAIDTAGLPAETREAPLECKDKPPVGHPVGAFGHPGNLRFTGTRGIISGNSVTRKQASEMLQTDASVNPGNSGGPLISLQNGRVLGINAARIKDAQNTNFAVPLVYACRVVDLLRAGRDPSPPDLPVIWYSDPDERRELRVGRTQIPDAQLPLRAGDVIVGVTGTSGPIEDLTQLVHSLRGHLDDVRLQVRRDGKLTDLAGWLPPDEAVLTRKAVFVGGMVLGLLREARIPPVPFGPLMVYYVEPGSPADFQEIEFLDSVESVEGVSVNTVEDVHMVLDPIASVRGSARFVFRRLTVEHGGPFLFIERKLPVGDLEWIRHEDGVFSEAEKAKR